MGAIFMNGTTGITSIKLDKCGFNVVKTRYGHYVNVIYLNLISIKC